MESIKEIFKIGHGPSSSHTMGPSLASEAFINKYPNSTRYKCTLFGSLAMTGKGHLTDYIIRKTFSPKECEIVFNYDKIYKYHPNAMLFEAFSNGIKEGEWLVFSVGGGSLKEENEERNVSKNEIYPHNCMNEILSYCKEENLTIPEYVKRFEEDDIDSYLLEILKQMKKTLKSGLYSEGYLPGALRVKKKAKEFFEKYQSNPSKESLVYAYALASSEENASGNIVVTSPTCGSCAVVPASLLSFQKNENVDDEKIIEALMVAGIIGNIVKTNASISGAEVGCQGEIGVACSMASAGLTYLENGDNYDIEYAAEVALEHHLGMTCDPVDGMVQIPCIERNAVAAMQAYNVASYIQLAGHNHNITLDSVIQVMKETGKDMHAKYRETSTGGLAIHKRG